MTETFRGQKKASACRYKYERSKTKQANEMNPATTVSSTTTTTSPRFKLSQQNRTFIHPLLPQPTKDDADEIGGGGNQDNINNKPSSKSSASSSYRFIICADTQFGMTNDCMEWETEMEYSRLAVEKINSMMVDGDANDGRSSPSRPLLFCCVCGDLVHMESSFYQKRQYEHNTDKETPKPKYTKEECDTIQQQQFHDFKTIWSQLHDDIALICLCGNHGTYVTLCWEVLFT